MSAAETGRRHACAGGQGVTTARTRAMLCKRANTADGSPSRWETTRTVMRRTRRGECVASFDHGSPPRGEPVGAGEGAVVVQIPFHRHDAPGGARRHLGLHGQQDLPPGGHVHALAAVHGQAYDRLHAEPLFRGLGDDDLSVVDRV